MKNEKKHLCIGIAFHNHEKQLSSSESILNGLKKQKLESINHTIIFADDSSTDNSRKILNEFIKKNKQLNIIKKYSKNCLGMLSNRNAIIQTIPKNATHFFSADGDDYMEEGFLVNSFKFMINSSLDFLLVPISFAIRSPFKKIEWHSIKKWKKLVLTKGENLSRKSLLKNRWLSAPWPYMISLEKINNCDLISLGSNGTYADMYPWFILQIRAITREISGFKLSANSNTPLYIYFRDGSSQKQDFLNEQKFQHIILTAELIMKKIKTKKMAKKFFYVIISNEFFIRKKDFRSIEIYNKWKIQKKNFLRQYKLNKISIFLNKGWKIYLSRLLRLLKIIKRPA